MNDYDSKWIIDERKYLDEDEVRQLRQTCQRFKSLGLSKGKISPIRDWFLVELGLNAGLRVSEMACLQHKDIFIDGTKSSIVVIGKGNKKRIIWINPQFKNECCDYIKIKSRLGYNVDGDSFLLNNRIGTQISKRALQKSFKRLLRLANLPPYYSCHCLRHTYSTFLLKASNNNYRFAQKQLGHSSIRTTQVYAGILESEGRKALERLYQ